MENMDKGLTVPKWVLINWPKIPQNLSAQIVCPEAQKFGISKKKRLHWASIVRAEKHRLWSAMVFLLVTLCHQKEAKSVVEFTVHTQFTYQNVPGDTISCLTYLTCKMHQGFAVHPRFFRVTGLTQNMPVTFSQLEIKTFSLVLEFEMWCCGMN